MTSCAWLCSVARQNKFVCSFVRFHGSRFKAFLQDYVVFFALKQNTNIYNLKAAAALNVSVTDDSYMSAPADCTYANSTQKAGSRRLLDMDMGSDTVKCAIFHETILTSLQLRVWGVGVCKLGFSF